MSEEREGADFPYVIFHFSFAIGGKLHGSFSAGKFFSAGEFNGKPCLEREIRNPTTQVKHVSGAINGK